MTPLPQSWSVVKSPPSARPFRWLSVRVACPALLAVLAAAFEPSPARAEPISSIDWDFAAGSGGWVSTNTFITSPPPQAPR